MPSNPARPPRTHCPYCALQCAVIVEGSPGRYRVRGDPDFDVNRGELCVKGFTAGQTLSHPGRLLAPLIRDGGVLREATWDEALERVANGFRTVEECYGPDAVGVFGSGALTNEKAYALGKFARLALGTRNFDYNGRFCMSSAAAAANRAFGIDRGLPFPLRWLAETDCLLVAGGNPAETMPPLMRYLREQRAHGETIVVDPRRTELARTASLFLQPLPGTDVILATAILHVLIAEGLCNAEFIAARTTGFETLRRIAEREFPERAERRTGVPAEQIVAAARMLGAARSAIVLTARGVEQHANGTDAASAYLHIALAVGLPGRERSGYGTLTGQGNGQGGREHGQKSDQLPGYRPLDDAAGAAHVASVWGVEPTRVARKGYTAYELLQALGDGVRALFVMGSNPAVSAPKAFDIRERLDRLEHLVVCDFFLSETAERAHVVLPTLQWAEESGTTTNLEGRLLVRERCVEPPSGPRGDLTILRELAARLGRPEVIPSDDPVATFAELARASSGGRADYTGMTYERVRSGEALRWPCPSAEHPGTEALFADRFWTSDGRARFVEVEPEATCEPTDAEYPWRFTTGRVREHYLSGTQTRRVERLRLAQPEPVLEIHPQLAALLGVSDGDRLRVVSRRGKVELDARFTDAIRPDTTFSAFHWGGSQSVNGIVDDTLDPISGMPAFKACAVRIERVVPNA